MGIVRKRTPEGPRKKRRKAKLKLDCGAKSRCETQKKIAVQSCSLPAAPKDKRPAKKKAQGKNQSAKGENEQQNYFFCPVFSGIFMLLSISYNFLKSSLLSLLPAARAA